MRVHKLTFAALIVAAGLSLTACDNDDSMAPSDPSSASAASSSGGGSSSGGSDQTATSSGGQSAASGSSSSGGGSSSGGSDQTATSSGGQSKDGGTGSNASGKCRTDDLDISATDTTITGDDVGSIAVELKNESGRACTLAGFAGVDLTTAMGPVSAKRVGAPATTLTLNNGKLVDFNVNYPLNNSGGSGVRITGLRVTSPDDTKSVTVAWPGAASLPVTADAGGQGVEVGPIGSAGQGG